MIELTKFAGYLQAYCWDDKHHRHGFPADQFPDFDWIASLERRFAWLRQNCEARQTASIYLIEDMLHWGGTQSRSLQRLRDGLGEFHLQQGLQSVIARLGDPAGAIGAALQIPGFGLTYASKLLRFLDPERYGALDSRIREALKTHCPGVLPTITDGNEPSMIRGFVTFTSYLAQLRQELARSGISRPRCALPTAVDGSGQWRAADTEMALFAWAETQPRRKPVAAA